jgi:long-chain-fatty-acid--CoA ligase ACSBG
VKRTECPKVQVSKLCFRRVMKLRRYVTYGLGPHVLTLPWNNKIGSCGINVNGYNMTRIATQDQELLMYGRHVFMGYLNSQDKTNEAIGSDGWLHSGDIGEIDKDGHVFITGRIKELIITAGGENIQPVAIEDNIKLELPQCISNCMVIGDKRKFLACLISLKVVENPVFQL